MTIKKYIYVLSLILALIYISPQLIFAAESDSSEKNSIEVQEEKFQEEEAVDELVEKEQQVSADEEDNESSDHNSIDTANPEETQEAEESEDSKESSDDNTEEINTDDPNKAESDSETDNETESAEDTVNEEEHQEEQVEQDISVESESDEIKEDQNAQEENDSAKKVIIQSVDDFSDGVLENGESHEDLKKFKKQLNTIGFGGILETKNFGDYTEKKVREFQDNYGLNVNGKLDSATIAKLDEVYHSPFQADNRHPEISDLKVKLNRMGFSGIIVSDKYGDYTAKKVKQFQRYVQLEPNGIADATTREKLNNLYNYGFHENSDRFREISDFKEKLNQIGFGGIIVSDYYGSYTAKKVKEFQSYYGLEATGRANGATLDKIDDIYNNSIRQGMRRSEVEQLKRDLRDLGFGGSIISTLYGSYTEKQVKRFQDYYGLKPTGIVEEKTRVKINELKSKTPFRKGVRHKDTPELKRNLNRLGFGGILVSDLYGSYTEKQVEKFQNHYGLRVNGIADKATLDKINSIINSPLQLGNRDNRMIKIKEKLNQTGYGGIIVSNNFGSFTEKRVKEFQEDNNLPISGIIDEITLEAINNSTIKIFLDPGHGGKDPGGQGYGLKEKDLVLDIALSTADILMNNFIGVEVNLSRTTDQFIELEERARLANNWNADYFVSYHTNAFPSGSTSGFESYIHDGNVSKETKERQEEIHEYLVDRIGNRDRGKKEANFNVLRNTDMPAILLEYMFIDDFSENTLLRKDTYREWLGRITAEAISSSFSLKRK